MNRRLTASLCMTVLGIVSLGVWAQSEMSDEEQAAAFFEEVNAAPYTEWAFEPGVPEGFYVGQEPHGMILQSYINDVTVEAVGSGAEAFPEGSIIVKENHMPGDVDVTAMTLQDAVEEFDGELAALTYMVKMPGYNPAAGDWFWAKQQPDGTIDAAGKPAGCIGCHSQVADNDYVFNASLSGE